MFTVKTSQSASFWFFTLRSRLAINIEILRARVEQVVRRCSSSLLIFFVHAFV